MKKILLGLSIACLGLSVQSMAQPIMTQNFSGTTTPGMPTGWSNVLTAITGSPALGWQTTTAATDLYFGTVPNTPPHSEYAVCNEYADSGNHPACMVSPTFSLAGVTNPYLTFDYVFYGAYYTGYSDMEHGNVGISTDGGTTWTVLDTFVAPTISGVDWQSMTVNLSSYIGMTNCKIRFYYDDNARALIGAAVGNVQVFNSQNNDMALTSVAPLAGSSADYFTTGGSCTFSGTVRNMGMSSIPSYTVYYQVGAAAPVANTFSTAVASMATASFTCTVPYSVTTLGSQNVSMWVTVTGDPYLSNDTMATTVIGVPFMPTKKLAIEEATGTWCGWCVRGIVFMDSLEFLHPGAASEVAVHNSDPMTVTAYDAWMGTKISGYPSVVIDRTIVDDPSNILTLYAAHSQDFGYADISMSATFSGSTVTVPCTVNPAVALPGDNRLVLVLTEEKVHGTGLSTWDQHDYYANAYTGGSAVYGQMNIGGSAGYDFVLTPSPVPAAMMYYNHVNRSITPSVTGTTGLPGALAVGTPYTHTFTAPLTLTGSASAPAWVPLNMHAILMLLNGTTGVVMNTQNTPLTYPVGVSNVVSGVENFGLYPNPASSEVTVHLNLINASNVQLDIVDMSGRVVYTSATENVASGDQIMRISTANFAAGIYTVRIQTATGNVSERLSVIK